MYRTRDFRRAQLAEAKLRARNLWYRIWQVKGPSTAPEFAGLRRCYIPYVYVEPTLRWVAQMAETHCRPCSCSGCKRGPRPTRKHAREERSKWNHHPYWAVAEELRP